MVKYLPSLLPLPIPKNTIVLRVHIILEAIIQIKWPPSTIPFVFLDLCRRNQLLGASSSYNIPLSAMHFPVTTSLNDATSGEHISTRATLVSLQFSEGKSTWFELLI